MKIIRVLMVGSILLGMPLVAAGSETVLGTAGKILQIGVGARTVGMGEAGAAASNDVYALFWNPAGLAQVISPQLSYQHNLWLQDINDAYLTYAQRMFKGGIAISLNYFNFGEFEKIGVDASGFPLPTNKTFTPYTMVLAAGYGTELTSHMDVGGAFKLVSESVDTFNSMTLALDLGLIYHDLVEGLDAGLSFQNLGLPLEGYQLPLNIKAGLAYRLPPVFDKKDRFLVVADTNLPVPFDQPLYINLGMEYLFSRLIAARVGYKIAEINDLGGTSGLTAGLGVKVQNITLDYALAPFGDLGTTHRISLKYEFALSKKDLKMKRAKRRKAKRVLTPATDGTLMLPPGQTGATGQLLMPAASKMAMRTDIRLAVWSRINSKVKTRVDQVVFKLKVSKDKQVTRWSLKIINANSRVVKSFSGKGLPGKIEWNGKGKNKQPVKESIFCKYIMRVETADGGKEKLSGPIMEKSKRGTQLEPNQETLPYIYFNENSAGLSSKAVRLMARAAKKIKSKPYVKVMIDGHTDGASESPMGFLLSQRRAETVSRYLTATYKIPLKDLSVHARGSKKPIASNQTEKGRKRNRRVEITIIYRR